MSDSTRTQSTASLLGAWAAIVVLGTLAATLVRHFFGETWRVAAIRSAVYAISVATVLVGFHAWRRRSR